MDTMLFQPEVMSPTARLSTLTISTKSIEQNINTFRKKLGESTKLMAIIKASAYGTDMVTMGKVLLVIGIDLFGVAHVDEAITLRKAGFDNDIFVIYSPNYHVEYVVDYDLQVAVCDFDTILRLEEIARERQKIAKVHLHVNTGMNRFGCTPEDALTIAKYIHESRFLALEGIMSHFHSADVSAHDELSYQQVEVFKSVTRAIKNTGIPLPWRHMANTSAASRFHLEQCNMARIGIGMYGAHLSDCCSEALPLDLAVDLKSTIIDIRRCKKGETVSYEASYTVQGEEEIIGTLGIGYHDGIHRSYGNSASVCVNGVMAPYVGNICMDFSLINLTHVPTVKVGDVVTIFGRDPSGVVIEPRTFAASGQTNPHEMLACIGPRVHRHFIHFNN